MESSLRELRTDFFVGPRRVASSLTRFDLILGGDTELFSMPAALEDEAEAVAWAFENAGGKPGSITHLMRSCLMAEGFGFGVRADYSLAALADGVRA